MNKFRLNGSLAERFTARVITIALTVYAVALVAETAGLVAL
ncbi:MAG: hypothetical protein PW790_00540 [Parvibaculaceae bacterium]|nr:hypothetical protein [Parvibaculaceae bacterium]